MASGVCQLKRKICQKQLDCARARPNSVCEQGQGRVATLWSESTKVLPTARSRPRQPNHGHLALCLGRTLWHPQKTRL